MWKCPVRCPGFLPGESAPVKLMGFDTAAGFPVTGRIPRSRPSQARAGFFPPGTDRPAVYQIKTPEAIKIMTSGFSRIQRYVLMEHTVNGCFS